LSNNDRPNAWSKSRRNDSLCGRGRAEKLHQGGQAAGFIAAARERNGPQPRGTAWGAPGRAHDTIGCPNCSRRASLERLRPVLDEYQSALESTNEFRGKPAGMLRVTAPPPAGDFFLDSAIPRFLAQYPEISLDLSFNEALTDIVAERFDAGIRLGEQIERDMIAVRVTDELPIVVAGSPAYFAQRGKPKSPQDLVAHDCIRIRFSSGTYLPWRFRVKRRDLEVHVKGRLVVNSVTVARRAAVEGLGLVQGPPIFIATDLAEGRLVTALDQWAPTPATGFFLYYPSRRQMRPALKALVDFLRDERPGASQEASQ
jgi:DNA-binding transcriptional LysR family regulator